MKTLRILCVMANVENCAVCKIVEIPNTVTNGDGQERFYVHQEIGDYKQIFLFGVNDKTENYNYPTLLEFALDMELTLGAVGTINKAILNKLASWEFEAQQRGEEFDDDSLGTYYQIMTDLQREFNCWAVHCEES